MRKSLFMWSLAILLGCSQHPDEPVDGGEDAGPSEPSCAMIFPTGSDAGVEMCIDSVEPLSGPPGAVLTVTGRNLVDPWHFYNMYAPSPTRAVLYMGANRAGAFPNMTVPTDVGDGYVRATLRGQTVRFSLPFKLTEGFIFTRLGRIGDPMTINGNGLMPGGEAPLVTFTGGAVAVPESASDQAITLKVPPGAKTGPISVDSRDVHFTSALFALGQQQFYLCEDGVGCWTERASYGSSWDWYLSLSSFSRRQYCVDLFDAPEGAVPGSVCPTPMYGQATCFSVGFTGLRALRGPYVRKDLPDGGVSYTDEVVNGCVQPGMFFVP